VNSYIEAVCAGVPDPPRFNQDTEEWDLYFEESDTPWHPYPMRDVISYGCPSKEEAERLYAYYNQNPLQLETHPEQI